MPPRLPQDPPSLARRIRRIVCWAVIPFVVLVLGACPAENYRGHYLWNKYRKEWEAKGEQFDLMKLVPPPVPQDQNFATTPFFVPYLDYTIDETNRSDPYRYKDKERYESNKALAASLLGPQKPKQKNSKSTDAGQWQIGTFQDLKVWQDYFHGDTNFPFAVSPKDPASDVLSALRRYDTVLDELQGASARPYSVFPVHYQEHFYTLLPHLASLKGIAQILRLRALAHLEAGHPRDALRDVELNLRLADALKSEHFLISQLVRMPIADLTLQPIWEGLARRRWNEAQITELQSALARINFLEDYGSTMRLERALAIYYVDLLRTGKYREIRPSNNGDGEGDEESQQDYSRTSYLPGGVFRQNQLAIARGYQEEFIPLVNAESHHIEMREVQRVASSKSPAGFRPYRLYADLLLPSASRSSERFARAQVGFDLALIACALERYRLAIGHYPETMDALSPTFLAKIPPDVISGKPLRYYLRGDGRFVLYSVGWNQTDDNGVPGLTERQKRFDPNKGDWVWSYPAVASEKAKP